MTSKYDRKITGLHGPERQKRPSIHPNVRSYIAGTYVTYAFDTPPKSGGITTVRTHMRAGTEAGSDVGIIPVKEGDKGCPKYRTMRSAR